MTFTRRAAGLVLAVLLVSAAGAPKPSPPGQPAGGPGGKSYTHARVASTRIGSGAAEVFLFEPADPVPARAPVVVFAHGWAAMDPNIYGAWIAHLVRRGSIVICPRYQADVRTPVREFDRNALEATNRALAVLGTAGHVAADDRGLVFAGHSMGGLVAANLAVHAAAGRLPRPLALMSVEPGKTWPERSRTAFPLADLSALPSSLLLLTVAGDDDTFVRDVDAKKIYQRASGVSPGNKNRVRIFSDAHGTPALVGDHRAPTAPGRVMEESPVSQTGELGAEFALRGLSPPPRGPMVVNALDYYGTWKLLDGLVDAVFHGIHREYVLGDTPEQRFMGLWSDGVPVRELRVEKP